MTKSQTVYSCSRFACRADITIVLPGACLNVAFASLFLLQIATIDVMKKSI